MTTRKKNLLVFCCMILVAVGIYVWFYPLNTGELSVTANITGFQIISNDNVLECPQNPCLLRLKTGTHNIEILKSGYLSETLNIQILRGRIIDATVELVKIPSLNVSEIIPKEIKVSQKPIPQTLDIQYVIAPSWNSDKSKLAFIDINEERLKIWNEDNDISVITPFKNISKDFELFWSPDNRYLLGAEMKDLYFIDVSKASRKKSVIAFTPRNITWLQKSGSLLFNDESNDLYLADFSSDIIKPLAIIFDLSNAVWDQEDILISYINDNDNNMVTIEGFDPVLNEKKVIMTKYDFLIDKIIADEEKKIFFYNTKDKKWYNLDY